LTTLGKLQGARKWERDIWVALVEYANASRPPEQVPAFKKMVSKGMGWISGDDDDIKECWDVKAGASLDVLATRYLSGVRIVLAWLSDPEFYREFAAHAGEFLRKHGTAIRMHIDGNTRFNAAKEDSLVFEWPDECQSVISPVCKFILNQIERHDNGGENLREAIPIGMCDRQGCSKFRLIQKVRPGHFFCSPLCRATHHQKSKSKEEKAAYMRQHRATLDRHKPPASKRRR
jgi:hypothetical protein